MLSRSLLRSAVLVSACAWSCSTSEPAAPPCTDCDDAGVVEDDLGLIDVGVEDIAPDLGKPDAGPDVRDAGETLMCAPNELKGVCAGPKAFMRCGATGLAWEEIPCPTGETCYFGQCVTLTCAPDSRICKGPTLVQQCKIGKDGQYGWQDVEVCTSGLCHEGKCSHGCKYDLKLKQEFDCAFFDVNLTGDPGKKCASEKLLVVPSSGDSKLAVFDVSVNPPVALVGSPFQTCKNPSRIMMDTNGEIVATCREDGKVNRHKKTGELLWSTKLPNCNASRGVVVDTFGRLFAGCSDNATISELDPVTGVVKANVSVGGNDPFGGGFLYGLVADADGLYVALTGVGITKVTLGGENDLKIAWTTKVEVYGIADDGNGSVWAASDKARSLDTKTGQLEQEIAFPNAWYGYGLSAGLDGNVYVALGDGNVVAKITADGKVASLPLAGGDNHDHGLALDVDNNIYTVNMYSNSCTRIDALTGKATSFGQGLLNQPYGYSGDMTGVISSCVVNGGKTWKSDLIDGGSPKAHWLQVKWKATEPPDTHVAMFYRLDGGYWTPIENGHVIGAKGQKLQLRGVLESNDPTASPTLVWVAVVWEP